MSHQHEETPAEKVRENALSGESEFSLGVGLGPYSESNTHAEAATHENGNATLLDGAGSHKITTNSEEAHRDDDNSAKPASVHTGGTANGADDNASMIPLGKGDYTAPAMGTETGDNSIVGTRAASPANDTVNTTQDNDEDVGRSEVERVLAGGVAGASATGHTTEHSGDDDNANREAERSATAAPTVVTSHDPSNIKEGPSYPTGDTATEAALFSASLVGADDKKHGDADVRDADDAVKQGEDDINQEGNDSALTSAEKGKGRSSDDAEAAIGQTSTPASPAGGDKLYHKLKREVEERARKGQLGQFNKPISGSSETAAAPAAAATASSTKAGGATPSAFKEEFEPSETGLQPASPTTNSAPSSRARAGSVSSQTSAGGKSGGFMGGLFRRKSKRQSVSDGTNNNRRASTDMSRTASRDTTPSATTKSVAIPTATTAAAGTGAGAVALAAADKDEEVKTTDHSDLNKDQEASEVKQVESLVNDGQADETAAPADTSTTGEDLPGVASITTVPYETTRDAHGDEEVATVDDTTPAQAVTDVEPEYIVEVPAPHAAADDDAAGAHAVTPAHVSEDKQLETVAPETTSTAPSSETHQITDKTTPVIAAETEPNVVDSQASNESVTAAETGSPVNADTEVSQASEAPAAESELKSSPSQPKEMGIAAVLAERVRTNSLSTPRPMPAATTSSNPATTDVKDEKPYASSPAIPSAEKTQAAPLSRSNSGSKGGLFGLFRRRSSRAGAPDASRRTSDIGAPTPVVQETTQPSSPIAEAEQPEMLVLNEEPANTEPVELHDSSANTHEASGIDHTQGTASEDIGAQDDLHPAELETVEEEQERATEYAATEPDRSASLHQVESRDTVPASEKTRLTPAEQKHIDFLGSNATGAPTQTFSVPEDEDAVRNEPTTGNNVPKEEKRKSFGGLFGLFRSRTQKEHSPGYTSNAGFSRNSQLVNSTSTKDVAVGTEDGMPTSPTSGHFTEDDDAQSDESANEGTLRQEPDVPDNRSITEIAATTPLPKPVYTDKTQAKHDRIRRKREEIERVERARVRRENELLEQRERILNAYTGRQDFSSVPKAVRNKGFGHAHDRSELDALQFVNKSAKKDLEKEEKALKRSTSRGSSIEASSPVHPASGGLVGAIPLNKEASRASDGTAQSPVRNEPSSPVATTAPTTPTSPRTRKVSRKVSSAKKTKKVDAAL